MLSDIERWDCTKVVCVKEYKTLKVGYHYSIKGRGNLEFNNDPAVEDRKGWGLCIEDEFYASDKLDSWKLPYKDRVKWYYFTLNELNEYFITDKEDYKIYKRDLTLTELGIINQ